MARPVDLPFLNRVQTLLNADSIHFRAAFQYGVKMSDGRKTRSKGGPKDDKAALDREWQKIQNIMSKRSKPNN